jgi:FkbM family methyltransferase
MRKFVAAVTAVVVIAGIVDARLNPVIRPAHTYRTVRAHMLPTAFSIAIYSPKEDIFVSAAIADHKVWDSSVVRVLLGALQRTSHGAFIDCGANIGYFTLIAASLRRRVVAFEAASASADRLAFSLEENELQHLVTLYRNGVSDATGIGYLQRHASNQGGRSISPASNASLAVTGELVHLTRVDDVPLVFEIGPVAAVKIDVEGMEGPAILGMQTFLAKLKPAFVIVEVSGPTLKNKWQQATDVMHGLGYKLYSIAAFPPEDHFPVANTQAALQNAYFFLS